MASINEYVIQLQELTQQNLDILKAINDSFFTKQNHLSVNVGDQNFAMPSFLSLENKINVLSANLDNLIHAPETGEAFFNMDGNSRSIEVRPYNNTPNPLVLNPDDAKNFDAKIDNSLKDLLTPTPYIKFNVRSLPNDITRVLVKKIVPVHSNLVNFFYYQLNQTVINEDQTTTINNLISVNCRHSDLYKKLQSFKKDVDYYEYDTFIDLPIRKNIGHGIYVIEKIISDEIDNNLDNYITLKFRSDIDNTNGRIYMNNLNYRLFDETIEKQLKEGDVLTTFEGNAKVEIVEIKYNLNQIKVKVLNGEYLNLVESDTNNPENISSLSKMKFFAPIDFDEDKYVQVPIGAERFVFIAVAAVNNRMNIQSAWGDGVMVDAKYLSWIGDPTNTAQMKYPDYYNNYVKNIGDIVKELIQLSSSRLTKLHPDKFNEFLKLKPVINEENLKVVQINTHLNSSPTVKKIYELYENKKVLLQQLDQYNLAIKDAQTNLNTVPTDDVSGLRTQYESDYQNAISNKKRTLDDLNVLLNDINVAVVASEIPLENAKYRIRGFFDFEEFLNNSNNADYIQNVRGIRVQYRYKNINHEYGAAISIGERFIFSDWNQMTYIDREKRSAYSDTMGYTYSTPTGNNEKNEISFNQIDIPITQGESVDIRLKLVYDYGYPYCVTESAWSDIVNIQFPEELIRPIDLINIIEENQNDIVENKFHAILSEEGVIDHINDKRMNNNNEIFFHTPEHISSGFFTEERQIISLKEKLLDLNNQINDLKNIVQTGSTGSLKVSITNESGDVFDLRPEQNTTVKILSYNDIQSMFASNPNISYNGNLVSSGYTIDTNNSVITTLTLCLKNSSNYPIRLYPLFNGPLVELNTLSNRKFDLTDYCKDKDKGVYLVSPNVENPDKVNMNLQTTGQFITFRIRDLYTDKYYYSDSNSGNSLSWKKDNVLFKENMSYEKAVANMYPKIPSAKALLISSYLGDSYLSLSPEECLYIPIEIQYLIPANATNSITKTMSFDIRTSMYGDPVNYTFNVPIKTSNGFVTTI